MRAADGQDIAPEAPRGLASDRHALLRPPEPPGTDNAVAGASRQASGPFAFAGMQTSPSSGVPVPSVRFHRRWTPGAESAERCLPLLMDVAYGRKTTGAQCSPATRLQLSRWEAWSLASSAVSASATAKSDEELIPLLDEEPKCDLLAHFPSLSDDQ